MGSRRVEDVLPSLGIHVFGALVWVAFLGFSADSGSTRQFYEALAFGAATWLLVAGLILLLWSAGKSVKWTVGIPFLWWYPSFILMTLLVYDTPRAPVATPPGVLAATTVSLQLDGTLPTTTSTPSTTTSPPSAAGLCRLDGIRYAGTTAHGAEVCFTLTRDRSAWVEIGFSFVCPGVGMGRTYTEGPVSLNHPGQIEFPGFTATIQRDNVTKASGVFSDSGICPGKKFKWRARLARGTSG